MKFTNLSLSIALSQALASVSAAKLRGVKMQQDASPQAEITAYYEHTQKQQPSHRSLLSTGNLIVNNNCGQDITHAQIYQVVGSSFSPVANHYAIDAGETEALPTSHVQSGENLYFVGLRHIDGTTTEVGYSSVDVGTFTFNGEPFDFYKFTLGDDLTLDLCTQTVEPQETEKNSVLLVNNCGQDITHLSAYYNNGSDRVSSQPISIPNGGTLAVEDVDEGTKIHYVGFNYHYNHQEAKYDATEVAITAEKSSLFTTYTFNHVHVFDYKMKAYDSDLRLELCDQTVPAVPPPPSSTLTIRNNCGKELQWFDFAYNDVTEDSSWGRYDQALANGAVVDLPNVGDDTYVHFYAVNYEYMNGDFVVTQYGTTSTPSTAPFGGIYYRATDQDFDRYMKQTTAGQIFDIC